MYMVFNIGCIECGVGSNIVGLFSDPIKAQGLADKLQVSHAWRQGGQNDFEVFKLPDPELIADEYTSDPV